MRCLQRNKRSIYLCNQYEENGIRLFTKPKLIKINYQSTNSDSDLIALGMEYPMYARIKADLEYKDIFHTGDRVFINTPIEKYDELGKEADYQVDSEPIISLNSVEVTLKKLSAKQ